jgi:hypothetical protein
VKLSLKSGEHLRLSLDTAGASFRVYLEGAALHVTATQPGEAGDVTVVGADGCSEVVCGTRHRQPFPLQGNA